MRYTIQNRTWNVMAIILLILMEFDERLMKMLIHDILLVH